MFHMDEYTECRYYMILGRDMIMALGLAIKYYKMEKYVV